MSDDLALRHLLDRLMVVRKRFDAKEDNWRLLLLIAFREFVRTFADRKLTDPIQVMVFDVAHDLTRSRQPVGRPPDNTALVFTAAAAAVSALFKREGYETMDQAIRAVARKSGLDVRRVKNYRDNINREKVAADVPALYKAWLSQFEDWASDEILNGVTDLKAFVP